MSITKRILESAQSGLSRVTSLVIADDEPLSHVESAALQAELVARRTARARDARAPLDNPLARIATSAAEARAARERDGRARAARVHRERDDREARGQAAADEAFRRAKAQAAREAGAPRRASAPGGSSSRAPRSGSAEAQLAAWYRVLDVEVGADLARIKSAYRQLMRKYHPDMHAGNPQKQKAATELSMRVTTAYNGLVAHLAKR